MGQRHGASSHFNLEKALALEEKEKQKGLLCECDCELSFEALTVIHFCSEPVDCSSRRTIRGAPDSVKVMSANRLPVLVFTAVWASEVAIIQVSKS